MFRKQIPALLAGVALAACATGKQGSAAGDVALVTPANHNYLPVGSTMTLKLDQAISMTSQPGDTFSATVADAAYTGDNMVGVPAGATLAGRVTGVRTASEPGGRNIIRVNFDELRINGRSFPFNGSIASVAIQNHKLGTSVSRCVVLSGNDLSRALADGAFTAAPGSVIAVTGGSDSTVTIPAGSTVVVRAAQPVQVR
jgi:hypothetical protein